MKIVEESKSNLTIITISDIGSNHRALLLPNQDSVNFSIKDSDFVLAIADGVGSCKNAHLGSEAITQCCKLIFEQIYDSKGDFDPLNTIQYLIDEWKNSIVPNDIDDCCTTLKAVFKFENTIHAISVGDGFIAISSDGLSLLSPMEENNFTNETKCLNSKITASEFWYKSFHIDTHKSFALLCCTDGIANGLQSGHEISIVQEIENNISVEKLKTELLAMVNDISDYCFDDKTLGVIKYAE